jgi:hypothetical protein
MTNQNLNGETKSSLVDARLTELNELLQTYLDSLKLNLHTPSKASDWLNLDEGTLQQFSAEACSETAFKLSQYGTYIQKEINRHKAIYNWAENSIIRIIAPHVEGYGSKYTPFIIKKALAIRENPMAKALQEIQVSASNNLTSLEDMPRRIDSMVQTLKELSMVRRKQ